MAEKLVCNPERMNVERMGAWGFVLAGGLFWTIAAFSGPYAFGEVELTRAFGSALLPLALTLAVFLLGVYSEITAAMLLVGTALTGVVVGVWLGWEPALWALMLTVFVAPMTAAAALYYLAWRMEAACGGEKRAIGLLES